MDVAAVGAPVRPKAGTAAALAGAADEPAVAAPVKLKLLRAPVTGVLATAAGALAGALAAPGPKENPGELGGTGAAASSTYTQPAQVLTKGVMLSSNA